MESTDNIVKFPVERILKDLIMICECGGADRFILRGDGRIECSKCDSMMDGLKHFEDK